MVLFGAIQALSYGAKFPAITSNHPLQNLFPSTNTDTHTGRSSRTNTITRRQTQKNRRRYGCGIRSREVLRQQLATAAVLHRRQVQRRSSGSAGAGDGSTHGVGAGGSLVHGRPQLQAPPSPGRIEGKVERLRAQREQMFKKSPIQKKPFRKVVDSLRDEDESESEIEKSPSPPPAPVAIKRRRVVGLMDLEAEDEEVATKRGLVRKLGDDFERVARESGMASNSDGESGGAAAIRTSSSYGEGSLNSEEEGMKKGKKKLVKGRRKIGAAVLAAAAGIRRSPRLGKRR